jgi:hypothetical protein
MKTIERQENDKVVSIHTIKVYREAEVQFHTFLSSQIVSASYNGQFTSDRSRQYQLDRSLGGPQSRSGSSGGNRLLLPLQVLEHQTVNYTFVSNILCFPRLPSLQTH